MTQPRTYRQSELIEGHYLSETIEPGETLVVWGIVRFPKPLDDNESGGVECEPQTGSYEASLLNRF